jgi:hypothetical protein
MRGEELSFLFLGLVECSPEELPSDFIFCTLECGAENPLLENPNKVNKSTRKNNFIGKCKETKIYSNKKTVLNIF